LSTIAEHTIERVHQDKSSLWSGMWVFLFTELVLFGGLFLIFAVYRYSFQTEFHVAAKGLSVTFGALNTFLLITSSLTVALSFAAFRKKNKFLSISTQMFTMILAFGFLINRYVEWNINIQNGNFPGSKLLLAKGSGEIIFFNLYYLITGLHTIHLIIGIFLLEIAAGRLLKGRINAANFARLETAGLYWQWVCVIWLFLFPLFYLIS